jgi:hypothetical protein
MIVIKGLPDHPRISESFGRLGYQAFHDGKNWRIPADDRALSAGPPDVLCLSETVDLYRSPPDRLADYLISSVPDDFQDVENVILRKVPKCRPVYNAYGLLGEIDDVYTAVALCSKEDLKKILVTRLIPLLIKSMQVRYAVAVSVNASSFQEFYTFVKIMGLIQRHGVSNLEDVLFHKQVYRGIEMPSGLDILGFVDALSRHPPSCLLFQ